MNRIRRDQTTATVSDQLARDIVAFCNTRHLWSQDLDQRNKKIVFGDDLTERFFVELNGNIEMRLRGLLPKPPPAALNVDFRASTPGAATRSARLRFLAELDGGVACTGDPGCGA